MNFPPEAFDDLPAEDPLPGIPLGSKPVLPPWLRLYATPTVTPAPAQQQQQQREGRGAAPIVATRRELLAAPRSQEEEAEAPVEVEAVAEEKEEEEAEAVEEVARAPGAQRRNFEQAAQQAVLKRLRVHYTVANPTKFEEVPHGKALVDMSNIADADCAAILAAFGWDVGNGVEEQRNGRIV
eukprot:746036-Prorocentrum_minimum.AAC.1